MYLQKMRGWWDVENHLVWCIKCAQIQIGNDRWNKLTAEIILPYLYEHEHVKFTEKGGRDTAYHWQLATITSN
jgi:hypothetical protein